MLPYVKAVFTLPTKEQTATTTPTKYKCKNKLWDFDSETASISPHPIEKDV